MKGAVFMSGFHGERLKVAIYGESHGPSVGLVVDGLPPGLTINIEEVAKEMKRRAPGRSPLATPRKEQDEFLVESGLFHGKTTGTPLCVRIPNSDTRSGDYALLKDVMRPGHADYAGRIRYMNFNDCRGGGHFSGRLTAPLVFAGAVAKQLLALQGIRVAAHIASVGNVEDVAFNPMGERQETLAGLAQKELPVLDEEQGEKMRQLILAVREQEDSVGGKVECMVTGLPAGLGDPFFDSVESRLAHALFSIPAIKGLEFGAGFALAAMQGSEANDPMQFTDGEAGFKSNNNGGLLGGITTGMPLFFKVAVKPTPSIGKPQETVDLAKRENTVLQITGRHDPSIVLRAVPVVEGVAAWIISDLLLSSARNLTVK